MFWILHLLKKLDIECDGEYWHSKKLDEDERRDEYLRSKGWTVLRFKSKEIKEDFANVIITIRSRVEELRSNNQSNY